MSFIEISITCLEDYQEILMAEISQLSYDSIIETDAGFNAYVTEDLFDQKSIDELFARYEVAEINYAKRQVAKENWNADWEKNYDPMVINDQCIVRAAFHEISTPYKYDIIITPKMSFGTGHHETTSQVLTLQMGLDHEGKSVMDAGCGTGVLSIMAEKRGATSIDSFDIDDWCVDNSEENYQLNNCNKCTIQKGTIAEVKLSNTPYDIVIANINKNILLSEMDQYAKYLVGKGDLLLSGFYIHDLEDIKASCVENGLFYHHHITKNNWVAAHFIKEN
jgi:ribosomal protein L11 methyltransferase